MMKSHKVSVIIPVYNSEKFLMESLNSVLDQTYNDYEVICVDDGSTDNSGEILKQYSDKITIITQKNQGLASALNEGLTVMKGNWFKWFSPDDVMYPETLETLVEEGKNHNNTIIYSNWEIINNDGKKIRNFSETNYNNLGILDFNTRILDGQLINVNTSIIPASLFKRGLKINFLIDPVLIDYDIFLRSGILFQAKFYLIEKPLIKFRIHENQLSHQHISESLKKLNNLKDSILREIDPNLKAKYLENLKKFRNHKSVTKRSMEVGLKFTSILPDRIADRILVFYLNSLRRSR